MNKKEAMKQIEELEAKHAEEIAKLKAIIEEPDTSELVFKPIYQEKFWFIQDTGHTQIDSCHSTPSHQKVSTGNCFRTEEDAKSSAKYYIMNSEYDYWFPWTGQPKPKVLPRGLEYWGNINSSWIEASEFGGGVVYRWKRSEQV